MAGGDSEKQLLTLLRGFATEKSQGERRIAGFTKQMQDLRSELDAAIADLEDVKCLRETTEKDLRGHEVELAMNEASIQALEARISLIQEEISKVGSEVKAIKSEENALRDEFIGHMFELNKTIRKFHDTVADNFREGSCVRPSPNDGDIENELECLLSETNIEEEKYQEEQNIHNQIQQELVNLERQMSLMEAIIEETKELQKFTRQITEMEEVCASLGEELQKRCVCPRCHLDNLGSLGGILEENQLN